MLLLIDLDGTLINTVHPTWRPYKDGQDGFLIEPYLNQLPFFLGAKKFLTSRKSKGDKIVVISDSHFRYVNPICDMLDVERISLADKPNTKKLKEFLDGHPDYKQEVDNGDCFVIGDTRLDIELGRQIGAMTIWFLPYQITEEIKDERDGIGEEMLSKKYGPTYDVKTFNEMERIIDAPLSYLYSIEATFADSVSYRAVKLNFNRYKDGSYACIRCLARQEQGACDKYARADKYYIMSNPQRTQEFIRTLAEGISNYINQPALVAEGWDYFTYLTDKSSTTPPNKMMDIFDLVETSVPKVQLLKWADNVHGSLREQNLYNDRQTFLQNYLSVDCPTETSIDMFGQEQQTTLSISGKNIIVLDDQLTTAATAWHVIRKLKEKGARNVLFVAMFQMTLSVNNGMICPICGKPMLIKIRRTDGHRFYSCTPPEYRGDGCGFIQDIPEQN
jgi:Predicted phosphatases